MSKDHKAEHLRMVRDARSKERCSLLALEADNKRIAAENRAKKAEDTLAELQKKYDELLESRQNVGAQSGAIASKVDPYELPCDVCGNIRCVHLYPKAPRCRFCGLYADAFGIGDICDLCSETKGPL